MTITKSIFSLPAAAILLASLFASNLHADESQIGHIPSENCISLSGLLMCTTCREQAGLSPLLTPGNVDWRIQNELQKAGQLVRFRTEDDDDDDRGEKPREKKKAKQLKKSERSRKSQIHHGQPNVAPIHPEVLELLTSMNRSLKSIEAMMREEKEHDRNRPEPAFQHMNRTPTMLGPQNFNRPLGPRMQMPSQGNYRGPQPQNLDSSGPRNFAPRNDGPWNNGAAGGRPRNDGPRNDGPRNDGPRNDGPRNDGPRNDGPRNDGPRN